MNIPIHIEMEASLSFNLFPEVFQFFYSNFFWEEMVEVQDKEKNCY